jgi:hypothetical protein
VEEVAVPLAIKSRLMLDSGNGPFNNICGIKPTSHHLPSGITMFVKMQGSYAS